MGAVVPIGNHRKNSLILHYLMLHCQYFAITEVVNVPLTGGDGAAVGVGGHSYLENLM